jgi:hypothetical protein
MEETQTIPERSAVADEIWATVRENAPGFRDLRESYKETEKQIKQTGKRAYLGAIAGTVFNREEKVCALEKGFYVIEPSGDTFNITEPKDKYRPRVWQT